MLQKYARGVIFNHKTVNSDIDRYLECTWGFHELGKWSSIPVDTFGFCRSFKEKSERTIKIKVAHDFVIIDVQAVIKRNRVPDFVATLLYKINFWARNRMNCKLCKVIRRNVSSIVDEHSFMHEGEITHFQQTFSTQIWSLTSICKKCHQWLNTMVAGKKANCWKECFLRIEFSE